MRNATGVSSMVRGVAVECAPCLPTLLMDHLCYQRIDVPPHLGKQIAMVSFQMG